MGGVVKSKLDYVLRKLFYDPKSTVAFTGISELYHAAKSVLKRIRYKDVQEWLRGESTYTLHKPIRRRFKRRKTIVGGIDYQWQADLADMQHLAKQNNNKKYLLCVIDVFSKFSWVIPIQNKMGKTLIEAFQSIVRKSKRKPLSLQTDKGTEFKNKLFQQYLKKNQIHFFTTENPETKASVVERFQRTLKTRMWKYFTHNKTTRYINVLKSLVKSYNHTFHRSIKSTPASVTNPMRQKFQNICIHNYQKVQHLNSTLEIKFGLIKQNVLLIKVIYQIGPKKYLKSHMSTKHFHPLPIR